ncbi:hypothetical protein FGRMN_10189 [Fusarium graminum]|nr:hypothetical protein FGRMN_10189 [Fusarium graminum]
MRSFSGLTIDKPDLQKQKVEVRRSKANLWSVYQKFEVIYSGPTSKRNGGKDESYDSTDSQDILSEDHVWLEVPNELQFVHVEDPYAEQFETIVEDSYEIGECSQSSFTPEDTWVAEGQTSVTINEGLYAEEVGLDDASSSIDPVTSRLATLHLIKHYKEGPGTWFDIFDTGCYFSGKVPVKAATSPLLKSSICAISAKHLFRLNKSRTTHSQCPDLRWRGYDWLYESAKHYSEAIRHLKTAVHLQTYENDLSEKEDMLAAVAILCIYELMDAPGTAWRAHLSALPLFKPTEEVSPLATPVVIPRTAIQGPILWSLARQDLLCAFISETQTRLDLKDVRLWQNAGLATTEDGTLMPFSPLCSADIRTSADVEEDTKSNELTWLIGKLSNHLTSGDAINPTDYALPLGQRPPIGVTQERLLERWKMLMAEFKKWHESLPTTFTPYARTPYPYTSRSCFNSFEQIWYELPICAATMQNYHMAMILLLVNQPQESTFVRSTVSARLNSYRRVQRDVHVHAREICGVGLADPSEPVRANSVQALFVAGQVFHKKDEQDAVLELLSDIERDLGWTTRFHRAKLVDEWPDSSV